MLQGTPVRSLLFIVFFLCPVVVSVSSYGDPAFVQNSPQFLHPSATGGMKKSTSQVFYHKASESFQKEQAKIPTSETSPPEPTQQEIDESERRKVN